MKYISNIVSFFKAFRLTFCLAIVVAIAGIIVGNIDYSITVPGTVFAKNGDIETRYKSRKIVDVYRIAVRPDNPEYEVYDVKVSFSTYVTTEIGQHVAFNIENPKAGFFETFMSATLIVLILLLFGVFIIELYNFL